MNLNDKTYWNERARSMKPDWPMVFNVSDKNKRLEEMVKRTLQGFETLPVLDIGCGYGRFSELCKNYCGVDFSEEMIKHATRLHPDKNFIVADCLTDELPHADVVFEVISLSSLQMTSEQFFNHFKKFATKYVITCEPDQIIIYPL